MSWSLFQGSGQPLNKMDPCPDHIGFACRYCHLDVWLEYVNEERWLEPSIGGPITLLLVGLMIVFWRAFSWTHHFLPLFAVLGWFIVTYGAMIVALYPLVIISQASSAPLSQLLVLGGFAILIPVTLVYSTFGFWVFRGKIRPKNQVPTGDS